MNGAARVSMARGKGLPRVPAGFAATERAAAALQGLPSLVVVHAPRGYGKTATVSAWLQRPDVPHHDVVWISLSGSVGSEAFWTELLMAVAGAAVQDGVSSAGGRTDGQAVELVHAVAGRRPLVVVVDGYDRVRDFDVDEELVELARSHEGLRIVLLTRSDRPAVSLARAAAPEGVVLEAGDLALSPASAAALAAATGSSLPDHAVARLADDLGGWPALVRVALPAARLDVDGEIVVDVEALAEYLRVVLAASDHGDVLLATALHESVTPEEVERLLEPSAVHVAHAVGRLVRWGLLRRQPDGSVTQPALLRAAVRLLLREEDPGRYRLLSAEAARAALAQGRPDDALEHALATQRTDLVAEVVEGAWPDLVRDGGSRLRTALRAIPTTALDTSSTTFALRHVAAEDPPRWFVEALQSGLPTDAAPGLGPLAGGDAPAMLLRLGHVLLGQADAVRACRAWFDAARHPSGGEEAREATAGVALAALLLGHARTADAWLERMRDTRVEGTPGPLEALATGVLPALAALDRLEDVPEVVAPPLPDALRWLETLGVYGRANRTLLFGGPDGVAVDVLAELEEYASLASSWPPMAGGLLTVTAVDLCIATEQLSRARRTVERAGYAAHDLVRAATARLALYTGDDAGSLELTGEAFALAPVRPRAAFKLAVVRAVAAHRTGDRALSREAAHLALGLAERTGLMRPLVLVPRHDLEEVLGELPGGPDVLARLDGAHTAFPFPEVARVEPLSLREKAVLRELASDRPLPVVARRLFVSESTVKTQVRSIYRKLGVHSRTAALERARLLGLLPGG
ncbi:LuxR C-terminal-related transcriptional regulator [Georgenia alba]|uniref:LuxR C-terminal-related transcriptional regulator n=1 Tax=Georgenia alba TaxID=2233858 RepID=A0ABW2QF49_9MICO